MSVIPVFLLRDGKLIENSQKVAGSLVSNKVKSEVQCLRLSSYFRMQSVAIVHVCTYKAHTRMHAHMHALIHPIAIMTKTDKRIRRWQAEPSLGSACPGLLLMIAKPPHSGNDFHPH